MAKTINKLQVDNFIKMLKKFFVEIDKGNYGKVENILKKLDVLSKYNYDKKKLNNDNDLVDINVDIDDVYELIDLYFLSIEIELSYNDLNKIANEITDDLYLSDDPKDKLDYIEDNLIGYVKDYYFIGQDIGQEEKDYLGGFYRDNLEKYITKIIGLLLSENIQRIYKEYYCGESYNNITKKNCNYYINFLLKLYNIVTNYSKKGWYWIEEGLELLESFVDPYRGNQIRLRKELKDKKQKDKEKKIEKVKELKRKGIKVVDISKQMGICKKTVYNYLKK